MSNTKQNRRIWDLFFPTVYKFLRNEKSERGGVEIEDWGNDNQLPDDLIRLYQNSPINQAAINTVAELIKGQGLVINGVEDFENLSVPNSGQNWNELWCDLVDNFSIFEGIAIEVVYNGLGDKIAELYVIPTNYVRSAGQDDDDNDIGYYLTKDWLRINTKARKFAEPQFIEPYNPETARAGVNQLLFIFPNKPGQTYYPIPGYYSGKRYIEADIGAGDAIEEAMTRTANPAYHVQIDGEIEGVDIKKLNQQIGPKLVGKDNAGGIVTTDSAVTISPIQAGGLPDKFVRNNELINTKITTAHRIVSEAIIGLGQEGKLGNANELSEGYRLMLEMVINPKQQFLINSISRLFAFNLGDTPVITTTNTNVENDESRNNTTGGDTINPEEDIENGE